MRRSLVLSVALVAAALACLASLAGTAAPPSIDAMVGTWDFTLSGTDLTLATGISQKKSESIVMTISQLDATTLIMHEEAQSEDKKAHYENGIIILGCGGGTDSALADWAFTAHGTVTGKGTKLSMKGVSDEYNLSQGTLMTRTWSARKRP
jgi:hypothetical protein